MHKGFKAIYIPPIFACLFFISAIICFVYIFQGRANAWDNFKKTEFSKEGIELPSTKADPHKYIPQKFNGTTSWQKYRTYFTDSDDVYNVTVIWESKYPVDVRFRVPNNSEDVATLTSPISTGSLSYCFCYTGTLFIELRSMNKEAEVNFDVTAYQRRSYYDSCPHSTIYTDMNAISVLFVFLFLLFCCFTCCASCGTFFFIYWNGNSKSTTNSIPNCEY